MSTDAPDPPGALADVLALIARLRGPDGCPWDREQRLTDVLSDLVEEAYELEWAGRASSSDAVFDEMGDVLFLLCFAVSIAAETDRRFSIDAVARRAHDKIRGRHPHVFGDETAETAAESLEHWERAKARERGGDAGGALGGVAPTLPPLRRAEKLQERAAAVGFDWPDAAGVLAKLREETAELERAVASGDRDRIRDEVGDVLFSAVNLARFLHVDASGALSEANAKFVRRFERMESLAARDGRRLPAMTLEEMDAYWERAKRSD